LALNAGVVSNTWFFVIVADLSPFELDRALKSGLPIRTGPVVFRITTSLRRVREGISLLYGQHAIETDDFADFHVKVSLPSTLRRWIRPHAYFTIDESSPFNPLPADQAFPLLEWGLNWCVTAHCTRFLILHAAVVERNGRAMILPAPPGSGKSTLCAGLIHSGWRLLSDELALIDLTSGYLTPIPRPVSLKNASIDLLKAFASASTFSPEVKETIKGRVAHMRPPSESVNRSSECARPGWLVLPRFVAGQGEARLERMPKAEALLRMAENAFNYATHGRRGFDALADLVGQSDCYRFSYSDLGEASALLVRLADES
jgi:HprK-related kinase A